MMLIGCKTPNLRVGGQFVCSVLVLENGVIDWLDGIQRQHLRYWRLCLPAYKGATVESLGAEARRFGGDVEEVEMIANE